MINLNPVVSSEKSGYVSFTNDIEEMNRRAVENPAEMIRHADKHYHDTLHRLAKKIIKRGCSVVLLAGPSSSGKTTTAHFLADALGELGHEAQMISLDDFYKVTEETPLRSDGTHDFECLDALRVDCIQDCLKDLASVGACDMPQFDFQHHCPSPKPRRVELGGSGIAVIEGLHALNPRLTEEISDKSFARIYISVKQEIRRGPEVVLTAREVRIVRRLVRDYNFRGTSPEETLEMWDSVMDGERKYIRPFRKSADFTVNSLHSYELGVLRNPALMLLHEAAEGTGWPAEEAERLSFALMMAKSINPELVPPTSLIREFIGGGIYE